jgi:Protein of unknown function (DUF4240)
MATIIRVNVQDLNDAFFKELGEHLTDASQVEIHIPPPQKRTPLLSETEFWGVMDALDWSQKATLDILKPAIAQLAQMPVVNLYLFADKLSEKLYQLDTRAHGDAYLAQQSDDYLSVDDFLYNRCAVVAEGKAYFEQVLSQPDLFPTEISFEPILRLTHEAYLQKTGRPFNYQPLFNIETYSNSKSWQ